MFTRRTTVVLLLSLVASLGFALPVEAESIDTWIVTLDPSSGTTLSAAAGAPEGTEVQQIFSHVISGMVVRGTAEQAAQIARDPNVVRVEPDRQFHAFDTAPSGLRRIGGVEAHESGFTGDGVRIAILDSGIDGGHPDLSGSVNEAEGLNCIIPGTVPNDDHGHGTAVAGIVAAASNGIGVVGIAPESSLVSVKVLASNGSGTASQVICGLDHVAGLAADGIPTIVNLSLGNEFFETPGCGSSALHQAICNLTTMGVPVIAAAGNDGIDASNTYPAAYPETIAVSAFSDLDGTAAQSGCIGNECDETIASFSNYGSIIDVAAPGVLVETTVMGGSYASVSGTSAAAPHVAGVAALALAADPSLSTADLRLLIQRTGECPDGTIGGPTLCAESGDWLTSAAGSVAGTDPDGNAEPLVNAFNPPRELGRTFPDVHVYEWWAEPIGAAHVAGFFGGYADGLFLPEMPIRRAEIAAVVARALDEPPTTPAVDPFPDVDRSAWYAGYVERLVELAVIAGYADGTFQPDEVVTRGEIAAIIVRATGELDPPVPLADPFVDVPRDSWYAPYVHHLVELGVVSGYPDGTFRPEGHVNRAEAAAFITRVFLDP